MIVNKRLRSAILPLGYEVTKGEHTGAAQTTGTPYFTFLVRTIPVLFADDQPNALRHLVQLHFYCPRSFDATDLKDDVCARLAAADFVWPDIEEDATSTGMHVIFETEFVEGVPDGEV